MQKDNIKVKFILLLFSVVVVFGLPKTSWAACSWPGNGNTGTAASLAESDVADCISDSSAKTGVVVINLPSGTSSSWSNGITLNMNSGFSSVTYLTIQGAGYNNTTITANAGVTHFTLGTASAKGPRITGIKFTGTGTRDAVFFIYGDGTNWRIDNNYFYRSGASNSIWIGWVMVYGLVDSNIFDDDSGETVAASASSFSKAQDSWNAPYYPGDVKNVYVENNTYYYTSYMPDPAFHAVTGVYGGRYVFRYNTVIGTGSSNFGTVVDTHGSWNVVNAWEANRWAEIYNNDISGIGVGWPVNWRGGDGLVFNNNFGAHATGQPEIRIYGDNYVCSQYHICDQLTYPAPGQMRNGYFWGNTHNNSPVNPTIDQSDYVPTYIHLDRDYMIPAAGTLAARPATCTHTAESVDVGYWATDQNKLYTCTATNGWTQYFAPYTCPHPLTGYIGTCDPNTPGTSGYNISPEDTSPPAAPTGLTVR